MAEDKQEQWNEMDVDSYRGKSNIEKAETDKTDFEVEEPEDIPVTKETVEAEIEEEVEQPGSSEEEQSSYEESENLEELDGIKTKGAEKRIRQLVQQRKEREEVIVQQNDELGRLRSELLNSHTANQSIEVDSLSSKEAALKERIKLAENAYLQAYDEGEKEKLLEAQNILQDSKTDLKFVAARKRQVEQIRDKAATQQTADHQEAQGYVPQETQQAQSGHDPLAVEWAGKNDWFGKDEVITAVALAIDQQLKTEGYDPSTSEFYKEVDERLKKELPNKFRVADNTQKPPQQVAGSSRKSSSNKLKVKLSSKDVSLAKKWGIPLDTYAAEKAKVSNVGDGYTVIGNN